MISTGKIVVYLIFNCLPGIIPAATIISFFRISKFWSHFLIFCHTHFLFSLLVGNGRAPNFNTISFASSLFLTYYCSSIKAKAIFFVVLCLFSLFYPTVFLLDTQCEGANWGKVGTFSQCFSLQLLTDSIKMCAVLVFIFNFALF